MKYISLFSGIEACSAAWHDLGWQPVAFAEFDDFPSAVLAHHYPDVPNLGDVTKVKWNEYKGKAQLIVGGSPCQSFSVAGKRLGMDDPRGNLALYFLQIIRTVRPKWFIYENVPGLLSSDGGRDFATFLGEVEKCGYGFAYRVLDAQHFGVPQRRRRLFVIGCADGDWRSAAAVLFEQESLCRDSKKGQKTGEGITPLVGDSVESESKRRLDKGIIHCSDVGPTMTSSGPPYSGTGNQLVEHEAVVVQETEEKLIAFDWRNLQQTRPDDKTTDPLTTKDGICVAQAQTPLHDPSPTLDASYGKGTGERAGIERQIIATSTESFSVGGHSDYDKNDDNTGVITATHYQRPDTIVAERIFHDENAFGQYKKSNLCGTLRTNENNTWSKIVAEPIGFSHTQGLDAQPSTDAFPTLRAEGGGHAVSYAIRTANTNSNGHGIIEEKTHTLDQTQGQVVSQIESAGIVSKGNGEVWETEERHMSLTSGGGQAGQGYPAVRQSTETQHAVRRLTPTECERLQGFPDGWTQIPYKGKPAEECPQTHRYKALGNSMAVPVMQWLGMRIQAVDSILEELDERADAKTTKQTNLW